MSADPPGGHLDVVLFCAGGWRVGCEARKVRASRLATAAEGGALDIEVLLDLPAAQTSPQPRQRLTLKHALGERDILVGGPVELAGAPIEAIHPLPPLLAARNYLIGLRALFLQQDGKAILLFDIDALRFPDN